MSLRHFQEIGVTCMNATWYEAPGITDGIRRAAPEAAGLGMCQCQEWEGHFRMVRAGMVLRQMHRIDRGWARFEWRRQVWNGGDVVLPDGSSV